MDEQRRRLAQKLAAPQTADDAYAMPEGSDPSYGQQFMPSAALSAYQPTWRDRLASMLMPDQAASPERTRLVEGLTGSRGIGNSSLGLVDFVPGVGNAFQAQEEARKGEGANMAMSIMPGVPRVGKAVANAAEDIGGKLTPPQGITAFHGSPHDFDRFDMSKIGTGEGAQAYGPGLYFAESEGVARSYRDANAAGKPSIPEMSKDSRRWLDDTLDEYKNDIMADGPLQDTSELKSIAQQMYHPDLPVTHPKNAIALEIIDLINSKKLSIEPNPGRMYEVRINADPGDFLDWDKPLSQQSETVRKALSSANTERYDVEGPTGSYMGNWTRQEAENVAKETPGRIVPKQWGSVQELIDGVDGQSLRDAGIPGVKYLDQGSRTAGEGSRNYVVFRDDIIDVVRKYGIAMAASMYGMDQVQQVMLADQLQGPQQ